MAPEHKGQAAHAFYRYSRRKPELQHRSFSGRKHEEIHHRNHSPRGHLRLPTTMAGPTFSLWTARKLDGLPPQNSHESSLPQQPRRHFHGCPEKAGLTHTGWGQGVCVGDYDNEGWKMSMSPTTARTSCTTTTATAPLRRQRKAHVEGTGKAWGTGCAFVTTTATATRSDGRELRRL